MLHALLILDDHHQIDALDADLQAPASAGDREERRGTPATAGAAGRNAAATLSAKHKSALDHVRDNCNALCVLHHFFGNSLVRGCHHFVQYGGGLVQPFGRILFILVCPAHGREACNSELSTYIFFI